MDGPKLVTAEQMRRVDQVSMEDFGIPGHELMDRAGARVVEAIRDRWQGLEGLRVAVVCGKGNNGADGLVVARRLHEAGVQVDLLLLDPLDAFGEDAAVHAEALRRTDLTALPFDDALRFDYSACDLVVDAILAKRNLGTRMQEANLVIGLGPGFKAGNDVHLVIETNRGHNLGRIITAGPAEPNTGIPGAIGGFAEERVLRAPMDGKFTARRSIGDHIQADEIVGFVQETAVHAKIGGVIRGLIRSDTSVTNGLKIGDVDPRGQACYCYTISDKSRAIGGSVLEAVLRVYN